MHFLSRINMTKTAVFSFSTLGAFTLSYFLELTATNFEQYLATAAVILVDGTFGIMAGIKREGFITNKALKIPKTLVFWTILLTVILLVEKSFSGTFWLSETIITPFLVFQLVSILKNASTTGWISNDLLVQLLDKIDQHKGPREI